MTFNLDKMPTKINQVLKYNRYYSIKPDDVALLIQMLNGGILSRETFLDRLGLK